MQIAASNDDDTIAALDHMKRSIRMAFCGIMQSTRLPPMAALTLAATAVGLLYTEVAAAHTRRQRMPLRLGPAQRGRSRSAADFARPRRQAASPARTPRRPGRRQRLRAARMRAA